MVSKIKGDFTWALKNGRCYTKRWKRAILAKRKEGKNIRQDVEFGLIVEVEHPGAKFKIKKPHLEKNKSKRVSTLLASKENCSSL
jgi:hypothetical protein